MNTIKDKDILLVGAGLTGLTAAFYLGKAGKDFLVIEKNNRVGGVINTEKKDGYLIETGPNTGVVGHPEVAELFEDLAGECVIEVPGKDVSRRYILKNGKWEPLPAGLWAGITTPLFSTKDKFRLIGEPFRARGKNPDETLSQLVIRRLGKSLLDYAVDPFILGVYAGDPSVLIPRYALPKLYKLEQNYGSFIGGGIKKSFEKKTDRDKKATRKVFSVKGGLSELTEAMYRKSGVDNFMLGTESLKIDYKDGKFIASFTTPDGQVHTVRANKLVTSTGAFALGDFMNFVTKEDLAPITRLKYANVVEVVLAFENWKGMPPDGFGGLIPFVEKRNLLGVLFMSTLFKGRAPENGTLFTLFLGGMRNAGIFDLADNELKAIIEKEFCGLMGITDFNPVLFNLVRHQGAIPQYGIDSGERFNQVDLLEKKYPGLIIAGNLKEGIGMADRIKQGRGIVHRVNEQAGV